MKLYIYGDGKGNFYKGRSPTGRVQYTTVYTEATFFSEGNREDAEGCTELGLSLYELEVSEPELVQEGTATTAAPGIPTRSFGDWAVHPMDLFNRGLQRRS